MLASYGGASAPQTTCTSRARRCRGLGRRAHAGAPPRLRLAVVERGSEEDQDDSREARRQEPEAPPLIEGQRRRPREVPVVDVPRYLCPDQHADAVRDEHEEALCLAADRGRRL